MCSKFDLSIEKCRARTRTTFGTYRHITCLNRNPTIWVHSHSPNITSSEMRWSDCVKRMIKIQKISRLGLTIQPVSTESGRCFQEAFWCGWPSVIWKGQSCCQTSCPKCFNPLSWIPAGFDAINLIVLHCEQMVISGLLSLALQKKKSFSNHLSNLYNLFLAFSQHHSSNGLLNRILQNVFATVGI